MKKLVQLNIACNPIFLGSTANSSHVELFANNLAINIEKTFNVKVDYNITLDGNSYHVNSDDAYLEMNIAEFIETNWHSVKPF